MLATRRTSRFIGAAMLFGAVFITAAVGQSASAQTLPQGMDGRYVLVEVAGHPLPYAPVEPGRPADAPAPEVVGSTLIIRPDGHFVTALAARFRQGSTERFFVNPLTGSITRDSTGYVMHWDGAGITPAQWQTERFSFVNEDQEYVYRRQGPPRPSK
jgi:hypothetical protein